MAMANRRRIGARYEERAAVYLGEHGYRIRDRNFYMRGGELDIVAEDGGTIVFVEVRFRRDSGGGVQAALESVDRKKQRHICRTALYYLQKKGLTNCESFRFDVLSVRENGEIEHIQNAFEFQV